MNINSNNRQTSSSTASTSASTGASNNTSQNVNTGLNKFSYADFVLLSSPDIIPRKVISISKSSTLTSSAIAYDIADGSAE